MKKNNQIKNILISHFLLIAMILMALLFYALQPNFLSVTNLMDILLTASVTGIMAMGGMVSLGVGEINFAVGAQAMVAASIIGRYLDGRTNYFVAILLAVAFTALGAFLISYVVIQLKVPSFIATLAIATILKGFTQKFANDQAFTSNRWPDIYTLIGQSKLFGVIPVPVVIFLAVGLIGFIITEKTKAGHYMFAVGSDPTACNQVGINVKKVKMISLLASSLLGAFAGILHTSITATVTLKLADDLLMPALCAAMLSATYYKIGFYNIPGTIVSSVILILIQNGVLSVGAPYFLKDVLQGIVLLISVSVIALTRKGGLPKVTFESA